MATSKVLHVRRKQPADPTVLPLREDGTPEGVNLSQLQEWLRCRYRWELKNRRHIERRGTHRPMDLGSAVHAGIAGAVRRFASYEKPQLTQKQWGYIQSALLVGINTWANDWKTQRGEIDAEAQAQLDEITYTAHGIAWKAVQDMDLPRWQTLRFKGEPMVEIKLTCDFLPGVPFYGTPDWVVKDRQHGGNVVVDYKIREALQPPEHEEVDLQLPAYQMLLLKNGIPTVGAIKYQIRAQVPRQPEMTKKKQMSRQRIATTWPIYKAALLAHGLDPKDYREMEQKLDVEFFRVDRLYRNDFVISSIWDDIILPLGQLFVKSKTQVRHMHFMNCNGCWAREFCLAELRGEDTDFLLETAYVNTDSPRAKIAMRPEDFNFTEGD